MADRRQHGERRAIPSGQPPQDRDRCSSSGSYRTPDPPAYWPVIPRVTSPSLMSEIEKNEADCMNNHNVQADDAQFEMDLREDREVGITWNLYLSGVAATNWCPERYNPHNCTFISCGQKSV